MKSHAQVALEILVTFVIVAVLFTGIGYMWRMHHESLAAKKQTIQQSSLQFVPPAFERTKQRNYLLKQKAARG